MKRCIALFLIISLLLAGCGRADNPTGDVPNPPAGPLECAEAVTDFSLKLLQNSLQDQKNTLVSPLSVLAALGMTANGADGETLNQMVDTLGLSPEALNAWIYSYMDRQTDQLKLANGIWLRDDEGLKVEEDFLETISSYYRSDIFQAAFDKETLDQMNRWVSDHTEGRIPEILSRIDPSAVTYLINALAFEDQWEEPYLPHQVWDGTFTREDGVAQDISMMHSTEHAYLETEQGSGFVKYYEGRKYAFAVLLPGEDVPLGEFLSELTGQQLQALLAQPQEAVVKAALPKFETKYEADLAEILANLGMADAFHPEKADFSRMATSRQGNIYISRVLHKTTITVAEEGTKAAAATAVEMMTGSAMIRDLKIVTLDRPFLYMLIDCENNIPFFIGAMMDMENCTPEAAEETGDTEALPALSAPPQLTVSCGDEAVTLRPGNYEWQLPTVGDLAEIITACGPAPLDCAGTAPALSAEDGEVRLEWFHAGQEYLPDSITAVGWSADSQSSTALSVDGNVLLLDGDYDVIEVTARWDGSGTAGYVFAPKQ